MNEISHHHHTLRTRNAAPMHHVPVLLEETINALSLLAGQTVIDGTFGRGGHARAIISRIAPGGTLLGIDQDPDAIASGASLIEEGARAQVRVILERSNFRHIRSLCEQHSIVPDRALFDLGFSTPQIENAERGFSFRHDGPLDMRLDPTIQLTAADIVNTWKEEALADLLYVYGDEHQSYAIARAIVAERNRKPIARTLELADIIARRVPRRGKLHPATKTFQALRIAVNDELGALRDGLKNTWDLLNPGGILAVITFHSGEDRIVKEFFKERVSWFEGTLHQKKPIVPTRDEIAQNPRARSAKLRALIKQPL